jgi:hypothetical protein
MTSLHPHARGARASACALVAVAMAFTASGCAVSDGSGATSDAARQSLLSTLDSTEDLLGGEWDNQDDPTPRGCVIPLWTDGELYPALRVAQASRQPDAAVDAVTDYWTEAGLAVATTTVGDVLELQGESEFGQILVLRVSAEAMTLQGESECRPEA